jgi:hypothetical protein
VDRVRVRVRVTVRVRVRVRVRPSASMVYRKALASTRATVRATGNPSARRFALTLTWF